MPINRKYEELASKWLDGSITESEKNDFAFWFNEGNEDQLVPFTYARSKKEHKARIFAKIYRKTGLKAPITERRKFKYPLLGAASVTLFLGAAMIWYSHQMTPSKVQSSSLEEAIVPGSNKAVLNLSSGKSILLDDAVLGEITDEEGVSISKTEEGLLVYDFKQTSTAPSTASASNTISTPKGGQYQVLLPDGSKVWLNAASSITFPVQATDKERRVKVNGEAYFEVVQNKEAPFIVEIGFQEIQVLGTSFNVTAYQDESTITTTLIDGSIKVRRQHVDSAFVLKPGEQAKTAADQTTVEIQKLIDTDKAVAWKEGYFYFDENNLPSVLKQLARWYDIKLVGEVDQRDDRFVGKIPRKSELPAVLDVLKSAGVKLRLDGRELIVLHDKKNSAVN